MQRQFTSTCYLIEEEKFLLLFHQKHQKWLPPGGHREQNETPPETARREVFEETGLEIEFICQENIWVDEWNAKSLRTQQSFPILGRARQSQIDLNDERNSQKAIAEEENRYDKAAASPRCKKLSCTEAKSIARPFSVLLEPIAAKDQDPAHEHIDFIYVARPIGGSLTNGQWFSLEEVEAFKTHEEVFFDTQETIRVLAKDKLLV